MNNLTDEFPSFPKIPRLFRSCIITEKLDGTNGIVQVSEDGKVRAGSRNRWLTPGKDDNYGFAAWVAEHAEALATLGPGNHYGEWWGRGINRNYGLSERRFSLFNVRRYRDPRIAEDPFELGKDEHTGDDIPRIPIPECVSLVPIVDRGVFDTEYLGTRVALIRLYGSHAAPGFMKPEGVVVYHEAANRSFKVLCENDDKRKG